MGWTQRMSGVTLAALIVAIVGGLGWSRSGGGGSPNPDRLITRCQAAAAPDYAGRSHPHDTNWSTYVDSCAPWGGPPSGGPHARAEAGDGWRGGGAGVRAGRGAARGSRPPALPRPDAAGGDPGRGPAVAANSHRGETPETTSDRGTWAFARVFGRFYLLNNKRTVGWWWRSWWARSDRWRCRAA